MTTYYAAYAALLAAVITGRRGQDLRSTFYWAVLIGLFVFSALRFHVGCDWSGYQINFFMGAWLTLDQAIDRHNPAHWALISLLNAAGWSYQWLNIATSGIFFFGVHRLARRQPDPLAFLVICFPILIVNMPMSAVKQAAAIGFMCLAYVAFLDRRIVLYILWVLIGSTFHSSILLFLLFAPFVRGRFNRTNIAVGLLLATPGAFLLLQTDSAELAANRYIDTGVDAAGAAFRLGILSLSGVFFLTYLARVWRRQFPEDYKVAAIGAWSMVGFFALFFVSTVIGDRFGYYLIPLQAMIFARIPYLRLGRLRQIHAVAPYAALTLVFLVWTQLSRHFHLCYLPYQFGFAG